MNVIIKKQDLFGKNIGETVGVSLERANTLVENGYAEHVDGKAFEAAVKADKAIKLKARKEAEKENASSNKKKEKR